MADKAWVAWCDVDRVTFYAGTQDEVHDWQRQHRGGEHQTFRRPATEAEMQFQRADPLGNPPDLPPPP